MNKFQISLAALLLQAGVASSFATLVVDYSGSYVTGNRNASQAAAVLSTGDYDFDGTADDRAKSIPWNSAFAVTQFTAPAGKTAVLNIGVQIANLNSSSDPIFGLVRVGSNSLLQFGSPGSVEGRQSLSAAVIVNKANFLNLSSAEPLKFLSQNGSLNVSLSFNGTGSARFLVQNGTQWYLSATSTAADGAFGASFNPATSLWYAFDPSSNQFFNASQAGAGVLGSTFNNINAFGVYSYLPDFDGNTAANANRVNISSFSANLTEVTPVPEAGYALPAAAFLVGIFFFGRVGRVNRNSPSELRL